MNKKTVCDGVFGKSTCESENVNRLEITYADGRESEAVLANVIRCGNKQAEATMALVSALARSTAEYSGLNVDALLLGIMGAITQSIFEALENESKDDTLLGVDTTGGDDMLYNDHDDEDYEHEVEEEKDDENQ